MKIGDKYIIEIAEVFKGVESGCDKARIKGFDNLVFDDRGLSRLKKLEDVLQEHCDRARSEGYEDGYEKGRAIKIDEAHDYSTDKAYQRGLDDAWECAKKIDLMRDSDVVAIFGEKYDMDWSLTHISENYSVSEVVARIKEKDIQAGDEVTFVFNNNHRTVLVTGEDIFYYQGFTLSDGNTWRIDKRDRTITKTGRHFPEIVELIKRMEEKDGH